VQHQIGNLYSIDESGFSIGGTRGRIIRYACQKFVNCSRQRPSGMRIGGGMCLCGWKYHSSFGYI